jgi:putative PIN family toxin of toxin-antitoxin system
LKKAHSLRAVLDTNIYVTAFLSKSATSPSKELLARWRDHQFQLLISETLAGEIVEKLLARNVQRILVLDLLLSLQEGATWIEVPPEAVQPILSDPDDDHVLACAVVGQADYLVTHDRHFDSLAGEYEGIRIVKTLPFLWAVRGDTPSDEGEPSR